MSTSGKSSGKSFSERSAEMRKVIQEEVSNKDLKEIADALKRKAKEGNLQAAKILLSYALGKPSDPVPDSDPLPQAEPSPAPVVEEEPQPEGETPAQELRRLMGMLLKMRADARQAQLNAEPADAQADARPG